MPTYRDVTARVRALIGDMPNHYADDNYLITYVNMAQGQLVSELTASGVREAMLRTSMLVPANTSRIDRWPAIPTLPNEIPFSDAFAIDDPRIGWATDGSASPTVSPGMSDPEGGVLAKRWTFSADDTRKLRTEGYTVAPALSYFGSASLWLRTPDAVSPVAATVYAGMADDTGLLAETAESRAVTLTDEWQRIFVSFQSKVITAAPAGDVRRCLEIRIDGAPTVEIELHRAVIRPTYADTEDVATAGNAAIAGRIPVLPGNLLVPDKLMERAAGSGAQWLVMRGPAVLADIRAAERLQMWDWRAGGIDLNPCRNDRELMIEYWGGMQDGALGSNVLEEELPITGSVEPLAAITAGILSQSRDQHAAAERFGVMKEEGGFTGAAGGLIVNLVTTFRKAQQAEPIRRQPYFGFSRYPGVSGNVIGAYPWNSN